MKAVFLIAGSDIGSNVFELAELCPKMGRNENARNNQQQESLGNLLCEGTGSAVLMGKRWTR